MFGFVRTAATFVAHTHRRHLRSHMCVGPLSRLPTPLFTHVLWLRERMCVAHMCVAHMCVRHKQHSPLFSPSPLLFTRVYGAAPFVHTCVWALFNTRLTAVTR